MSFLLYLNTVLSIGGFYESNGNNGVAGSQLNIAGL